MIYPKKFNTQMNGNVYNVSLEFEIFRDEHDGNVMHCLVDENSVVLEDEDGHLVEDGHDDYEDLLEDVLARDYEPDTWG